MKNINPKKLLLVFLTFIGGFYFFLEFFLPEKIGNFEFGKYDDQVLHGLKVMWIMAIGLGIINLIRIHGTVVIHRKAGLRNSLVLLLAFFFTMTVESLSFYNDVKINRWRVLQEFISDIEAKQTELSPIPRLRAFEQSLSANDSLQNYSELIKTNNLLIECFVTAACSSEEVSSLFTKLNSLLLIEDKQITEKQSDTVTQLLSLMKDGFFIPLGASMYALLAFFVASAAFNSFRVRSFEAFIMMVAAVLVILGQIPQGQLYISEHLPLVRSWVLRYVSTPAFRAIAFGASIAALSMAVRMWLSLEKGPMEDGE